MAVIAPAQNVRLTGRSSEFVVFPKCLQSSQLQALGTRLGLPREAAHRIRTLKSLGISSAGIDMPILADSLKRRIPSWLDICPASNGSLPIKAGAFIIKTALPRSEQRDGALEGFFTVLLRSVPKGDSLPDEFARIITALGGSPLKVTNPLDLAGKVSLRLFPNECDIPKRFQFLAGLIPSPQVPFLPRPISIRMFVSVLDGLARVLYPDLSARESRLLLSENLYRFSQG